MGRRKPAPSVSAPRNPEPWNVEIPETDRVLGEGDFDQLHGAITDVINNLILALPEGAYESPEIEGLRRALETVKDMAAQADGARAQVETLREYAEELQTAARDVAARVGEADEIRDAIERYPGTAPHAWADALRVVRTGGPLRDLWCAGKASD